MKYSYRNEKDSQYAAEIDRLLDAMPDFVKSYIYYMENRTVPYTRLIYIRRIGTFFQFLEENSSDVKQNGVSLNILDAMTVDDITEFTHFIRSGKAGNGKTDKETSVNNYLSALSTLFDYLVTSRKIRYNVVRELKRGRKGKGREVIYLDHNDKQAYFRSVQNGSGLTSKQMLYHNEAVTARDNSLCLLMMKTGLRVSEAVSIDLGMLDLQNCCVHVVRKEGKEDTVYFGDSVLNALKDYLKVRDRLVPNGEYADDDDSPLFLSSRGVNKGGRMTVRSIERMVKKYAECGTDVGKNMTPHKLRATYATDLIEKTHDLHLTQMAMNHESPETTAVYIHDRKNELEKHRNDLE